MAATRELHLAFAYSPKYRTYTCAAYVRETGHEGNPSHVYKVLGRYSVAATRADALSRCLAFFDGTYALDLPRVDHGRKPFDLVISYNF